MKLFTLFNLAHLILAAPANVKVVTQTQIVTVLAGADGVYTTMDVPQYVSLDGTKFVTPTDAIEATSTALAPAATTVATTNTPDTTPATTSTTPTPTSTSTTSTSTAASTGDFSGDGTYYSTGLGACGITNTDTDYIVAISHDLFDQTSTGNPNTNPVCGRKIIASYQGKSVEVTVTDRCEGCALNDLDFSPSAFSQLADQSLGRIKITWEWSS